MYKRPDHLETIEGYIDLAYMPRGEGAISWWSKKHANKQLMLHEP